MTETGNSQVDLVQALYELDEREDRASLAALRSGLGKRPGTATRMFPIVSAYLRSDEGPYMKAAFITAALFASHHHARPRRRIGSLGASLWRSTKSEGNPSGKHLKEGVLARFMAALDADREDLQHHLEGLVSLCESARQEIDWNQFYWDVSVLLGDDDERRALVQRKWAREFLRGPSRHDKDAESETEANDEEAVEV